MEKSKKMLAVLLLSFMALSTHVMKAQDMSIPVDDAVRIGKLDCGLTYYIRHNDYPEHRVNFYIAQRVGSLQEEESQRGLAHFLEHMAFNGSEHFNGEGKSIIDYTRSLGVAFGRDMNAYTSLAETVYNINDVPSTRQSAIDSCLLILKDWSGGLLLTDEEIDKERGVIHEEWRLSRSAQQRLLENQFTTLFPGSKYGERMPIGLMSVVDNFKYNELRDYYHKWYRPDNQALVIVGDVDVDHIEAKIKELFKDCVLDPNAAQVVEEPVPDNENIIFAIDKDKEQQYSQLYLAFKHDGVTKEEKTSINYLAYNYVKYMVGAMTNERFKEMAQEPDCPFSQATAQDDNYFYANTKDAFNLYCMPKEGQTEAAAQALMTEALRIAKYGFTATEYARAKEEYMSQMERTYNERNKVPNESYGRIYCANYLDNEPIPSIEQNYQLMSIIVPQITVEMINQTIQSFNLGYDDKNMAVLNFNQEKEGAVYPTAASLKAAIDAARNSDIAAYVDNTKQEPLMATLPKKGKIVKESANDHFGYTELTLSNGARVILKKTDYKENEIRLSAFRRGGKSLYSEKDWANLSTLNAMSMFTGLGNFTNTELDKVLAGKQASAKLYFNMFTEGASGYSTVKDLETMLQLLYLRFTAVTIDEKKFNQYLTMSETMIKNKDFEPEAVFNDTLNCVMYNHHWQYKPIHVDMLKQMDKDRILQIIKERTDNADGYTFIIVGSFDESTIRPLIEQYIASLPSKKGKQYNWNNIIEAPEGQTINHFTQKMETPKSYEAVGWYRQMPYNLENIIKCDILGQVLARIYLQKIREDAGAAYSTHAQGQLSTYGDNAYAYIYGYCPVKPEYTDMALQVIKDEMQSACNTIDATALEEAQKSLVKDHNSYIKENWYWMNVIQEYLLHGIDHFTGYEQVVNAQTPESIAAFARQLYNTGNRIEVVMTPAEE